MSKKSREAIRNNLAQALSPPPAPQRKRGSNLDGLLDEYAPPEKHDAESSKLTLSQPVMSQLNASQPIETPLAGSVSQPTVSQPKTSTLNLLEQLPDSAGYTKTPNRYYDHLCAQLTPDEQAIYSQLFRLSHGHGKDTCFISNGRLSERSGVPLSTLKRVAPKLIGKGLIEKISATHGPGKEQGITYRLPVMSQLKVSQPKMSQPAMAHNKENTQKENTQTQEPVAGVRVGSRFSIEECRRYAKHLQSTGQGINNPGGYATTINRTGEADELIERFLNPAVSTPVDASQCPDCQGSGFYYPNGSAGGV
ncbi:MAG: helix-turn-helix domain-containing protein, partial [Acidobacteria bacterium]|nr:helix-turn-helix domain-containing protein [Acidobacteriota bacterium]